MRKNKPVRTGITKYIPSNDRERELAEFWYHKGHAEAELELSPKFKKAAKKKVVIK